jgi:hypothetical protein
MYMINKMFLPLQKEVMNLVMSVNSPGLFV